MASDAARPLMPLDLVVLSCGRMGVEMAAALAPVEEVRSVTLVTSPVAPGRRFLAKLRRMYRVDGWPGLLAAGAARLRQPVRAPQPASIGALLRERCPSVSHLHVPDFHHPASLDRLRALAPDLGVVVGTYVLRPSVFTIPRLGCLNLHMGKAPEFRGSSPGFYEMLQGVPEVGVTVHRVTDTLDGGTILSQETFPLDLAPPGDPIEYLQRYQREVLLPNGTRLMAEAVSRIARGRVEERPQDHTRARTYRRATYQQKRELRRIVEGRRAAGQAAC